MAAFGFPRQSGLWDIEGNQLRVTTADPASEQWGIYWVSSHRYGPMIAAGGFVYALEATPYAQLDVFGTTLNELQIDPSSFATQMVEDLSGVTTFYANSNSPYGHATGVQPWIARARSDRHRREHRANQPRQALLLRRTLLFYLGP